MHKVRVLIGVGTLTTLLAGGGVAGAATGSATPGGVIHVATVAYGSSSTHHFVFTGAFVDAGVDRSGGNQNTSTLVLSRGSFKVNLTKINAAIQAAYQHLVPSANCSFFVKVESSVTLHGGTGAYVGIAGKLSITYTEVGALPTKANGQCNLSNSANPIGDLVTIEGAGTVSFT